LRIEQIALQSNVPYLEVEAACSRMMRALGYAASSLAVSALDWSALHSSK
jgi:hypothetical protein